MLLHPEFWESWFLQGQDTFWVVMYWVFRIQTKKKNQYSLRCSKWMLFLFFFFLSNIYFYFICMSICLFVCICTMWVPDGHKGQKMALSSLEFQRVRGPCGCQEYNPSSLSESKCSLKGLELTQDTTRPSSHHLDLFAPKCQRARNKRQRQETGWGRRVFVLSRGLPVAHSQTAVYKGKPC